MRLTPSDPHSAMKLNRNYLFLPKRVHKNKPDQVTSLATAPKKVYLDTYMYIGAQLWWKIVDLKGFA